MACHPLNTDPRKMEYLNIKSYELDKSIWLKTSTFILHQNRLTFWKNVHENFLLCTAEPVETPESCVSDFSITSIWHRFQMWWHFFSICNDLNNNRYLHLSWLVIFIYATQFTMSFALGNLISGVFSRLRVGNNHNSLRHESTVCNSSLTSLLFA